MSLVSWNLELRSLSSAKQTSWGMYRHFLRNSFKIIPKPERLFRFARITLKYQMVPTPFQRFYDKGQLLGGVVALLFPSQHGPMVATTEPLQNPCSKKPFDTASAAAAKTSHLRLLESLSVLPMASKLSFNKGLFLLSTM